MNYIEWKSELETFLVDLPYDEKQKVFSYFSEMYADKREAGYREEEIIAEFGAPYDVARRVLDNGEEEYGALRQQSRKADEERQSEARKERSAIFAVLLTVLAIPAIIAAAAVTFAFCVAGISVIASGLVYLIAAIGIAVDGEAAVGLCAAGLGLVISGAGVMLVPLLHKLVKLMWKAIKKLFTFIKGALTGGGNA